MLKHLIKRFLHSFMGRKHRGYHRYSSSDYKRGHYPSQHRPPYYPPRGHGYYKKKHSSYSS